MTRSSSHSSKQIFYRSAMFCLYLFLPLNFMRLQNTNITRQKTFYSDCYDTTLRERSRRYREAFFYERHDQNFRYEHCEEQRSIFYGICNLFTVIKQNLSQAQLFTLVPGQLLLSDPKPFTRNSPHDAQAGVAPLRMHVRLTLCVEKVRPSLSMPMSFNSQRW